MGNKDITEKLLEDYADIVADILNVLLLHGERCIRPEDLHAAMPRSIYKADGEMHEQERDAAKYWDMEGMHVALLGIENQTDVDDDMPVRILGYDGASYRQILNQREDARRNKKTIPPLYPVITIVLYFGAERWRKARNLKGILHMPKGLEPYVQDYRINLFEIQYLPDEVVTMFQSDFRYVAELFTQIRKMRDGEIERIQVTPGQVAHAAEVLNLMKVMTGDDRFEEAFNQQIEGGGSGMFEAFDIYEERGLQRGREEGLTALVCTLRNYTPDLPALYEAVVQNDVYRDATFEEVKMIYNENRKQTLKKPQELYM